MCGFIMEFATMHNEGDLLDFLYKSENRVGRLLTASKKMKSVVKFEEAAADLESKIIGSKVHFYGTRFMKLGHERSHVNIFIDVGMLSAPNLPKILLNSAIPFWFKDNSYWTTQSPEKVEEMMNMLKKYFKSEVQFADSIWLGPISTLKTPVPTLRVLHTRGRLQFDITFSSGIGVENTNLVHHMFSLQPEAYKLYHFVRIWIHIDEFSFKRYMVGLLVLFYLQNKNLMPSVVQMQEDVKEKFIEGKLSKIL